jgi:hypothetical protein
VNLIVFVVLWDGNMKLISTDDVLDEYLAPEKPKPNVPAIPEVPASTPESV